MHATNATAEEKAAKTVAVLPFEMHAPSSMAYMQDGLRDMLASRLAANGGAKIVEHSKVDELLTEPGKVLTQNEAVELARQLAVDYIVTGSLTSLGGSMSLDAKVFSQDDVQPLSFYASAAQENEVIAAINSLSWDIAAKVFGADRPAYTLPAKAAHPAPAAEDDAMNAFKTEHPEKIYKSQAPVHSTGTGSAIIMAHSGAAMQDFTKTQNLDFSLRSIDVGDVDGDGQLDVVLADISKVIAYHLVNNRLIEFGSVEMPARSKIHSVNLADLDANGKAEIYVSAADDHDPHSWAYEWDGSNLQVTLDDAPWYIRVLNIPREGPALLGQRGSRDSLLRAGIFRLMKNGTRVMPEERIVMPDYVNLFEFSLADVTGNGTLEIVAVSRADRLYVVRPNGTVLWVSEDFYGGTSRYIGEDFDLVGRVGIDIDSQPSEDIIGREGSGRRIFIPSRIIVMDVNQDGLDDVLVNKNFSAASRHIDGFRRSKTGQIHAMTWNGIALSGIWQTKKIDGYIPDFQFIPLADKENRAKLFVGLVLDTGWTSSFSKGESTMLSYDIELAGEKAAAEETKN
ncbi:MAG: VCBS repeat-containing protein [Proteobacteria bacterium]|nr:VCBS repeat-containing protein [Pseudomonadota bacterium]